MHDIPLLSRADTVAFLAPRLLLPLPRLPSLHRPMMLSAVAMCKLGHPEGETAWMKGASAEDIIYM